jgi:predicted MFS family arabinose efflux permease
MRIDRPNELAATPDWPSIVVAGSLVVALSMGLRQVSGLFLVPVSLDVAVPRETFGLVVAVQNVIWGLTQPIAGFLADRFGARPVALVGGLVYTAGLALAAVAEDGASLMVGLGVMGGLGQSGTAFAVVLAVVTRAAPPGRRAVSVGIASTASSLGMFILVPFSALLLDHLAWRTTMAALAVAGLIMATAAIWLCEPGSSRREGAKGGLRDAMRAIGRDRDYWLISLGFSVCGFQLAFVATYLPVMVADAGLAVSTGGVALGAIGLGNIAGTYLAGLASQRWPKRQVLACLYLGRAAAVLAFLMLPLSTASIIAFGAIIGLMWTATVPITNSLVSYLWGERHLGLLFGLVYVGHQLGAFVGAWSGGIVFDRAGDFRPMWFGVIAASLLAALCHLAVRERPRAVASAA